MQSVFKLSNPQPVSITEVKFEDHTLAEAKKSSRFSIFFCVLAKRQRELCTVPAKLKPSKKIKSGIETVIFHKSLKLSAICFVIRYSCISHRTRREERVGRKARRNGRRQPAMQPTSYSMAMVSRKNEKSAAPAHKPKIGIHRGKVKQAMLRPIYLGYNCGNLSARFRFPAFTNKAE